MRGVNLFLGVLLTFLFLVLLASGVAEEEKDLAYELQVGKNNYTFSNLTIFLEVRTLIEKNPEIEVVSYYDDINAESVGYVNILNGLGKNFLIERDRVYEISVRKAINLTI